MAEGTSGQVVKAWVTEGVGRQVSELRIAVRVGGQVVEVLVATLVVMQVATGGRGSILAAHVVVLRPVVVGGGGGGGGGGLAEGRRWRHEQVRSVADVPYGALGTYGQRALQTRLTVGEKR